MWPARSAWSSGPTSRATNGATVPTAQKPSAAAEVKPSKTVRTWRFWVTQEALFPHCSQAPTTSWTFIGRRLRWSPTKRSIHSWSRSRCVWRGASTDRCPWWPIGVRRIVWGILRIVLVASASVRKYQMKENFRPKYFVGSLLNLKLVIIKGLSKFCPKRRVTNYKLDLKEIV